MRRWGVLSTEAIGKLVEWSECRQKSKILKTQVREKPPCVSRREE